MDKKDKIALQKILGYAKKAIAFTAELNSYEDFAEDSKTVMACSFTIMQIGEICSCSLSDEFRTAVTGIPWANIKGMRNRIVHGYADVDDRIVWETIRDDLPNMYNEIKKLIDNDIENNSQGGTL